MNLDLTRALYADADPVHARKVFFRVFAVTLLIKMWLAACFPMTGDEAFFYQWGVYPDWGYSDHPPMVGWLLYVLNSISPSPLSIRFFTVLLWSLIALGMVDLLRRMAPRQEGTAWWLGTLFLLLPFTLLLNLVTTDTPLIFFVFLSGYSFLRGVLSNRRLWFVAAGIFLGCALLSKYFAGLLAIAYFVYFCRSRRGWINLLIIAACSAPLFAITIAFNAHNCWTNVMFNLINRNENVEWSWTTIAEYVAMMIYLITPWVLWRIVSSGSALVRHGAIVTLIVVPFALFLLLSMEKSIGLHWVLGFMPFVFLFLGTIAGAGDLRRYAIWTALYSVPPLLFLVALMAAPTSMWKGYALHDDIVFHRETDTIVATLRKDLPADGLIMGRAFTPSSILAYHAGEYFPTFGVGKFHARQDDLLVDFRMFEGRNIRIFDRRAIDAAELTPYFSSVTVHRFEIDGVPFWFADGEGFKYDVYRERILKTIAQRYYRIPSFLPVYGCQFLERYELPRP
ncbi:glycosyltransferase family 39 protein [uncultured Oxalicibacterium sp.]|uniref:ArnT family glycosyltransferase n=1 Tax=uncultured Oxalicibacterium sp. TaxID=1168540 RepID=UPI0025DE1515|nr:glycosyltransferase family 39 protein [uncultured Oxalicibacterium sp.]